MAVDDPSLSNLKDFDVFFFYGELDQKIENESDLLAGLMQPKRSMYYYRQEGAGLDGKENYPNSIALTVGLRYDIVNWVGFRNEQVTDGAENTRDRRLAMSQNQIGFLQDKEGNLDISVLYIPLSNYENPSELTIPVSKAI